MQVQSIQSTQNVNFQRLPKSMPAKKILKEAGISLEKHGTDLRVFQRGTKPHQAGRAFLTRLEGAANRPIRRVIAHLREMGIMTV